MDGGESGSRYQSWSSQSQGGNTNSLGTSSGGYPNGQGSGMGGVGPGGGRRDDDNRRGGNGGLRHDLSVTGLS